MPEELGIPEIIRLRDSWNKCPQRELFLRMAHSKSVPWHNVQWQKIYLFIYSYDSSGNLAGTYAPLCITRNEWMNK
jgi:hypothetical protein